MMKKKQSEPRPASPYLPPLRVAWWGRVSTEEQQDPTLSLPRQLKNSREALPLGMQVVAHFYDVESGRKDLALRGLGTSHEKFDIGILRDGGIQDLLEEAARTDRRFDAVICESIERIARRTYYGTKIEHDLENVGVALFAADEPISLTGKRATTILTRRVKQGVAEWYVLETLEKSWDGFCEHTRQGWNIGSPPYGYLADKIPHPVPARRAEGRTKTRLMKDPVRAPVIEQIFHWRVVERLSYANIRESLNADLDRYPPPVSPDPGRRKDYWSRSSVRDLLLNPKYTGFMVWNRRATKKGGKTNPPEAWVWSAEPTHERIVSKETFEAALSMTRRGSRSAPGPNASHPATVQSYLLRSFVICDLCGNRMYGKTRRSATYYSCYPATNHGSLSERRFPNHPKTVYVREDDLLEVLFDFFADHVFGPRRRELMEADLRHIDDEGSAERLRKIKALRRTIDDLEERIARQVRGLERDDDPKGTLFRRVQERLRELEQGRSEKEAELEALESEATAGVAQNPDLIDRLPTSPPDFRSFSEDALRRLFEIFRVEIKFNKTSNQVLCKVAISEDSLGDILEVGNKERALRRARSCRACPTEGTLCKDNNSARCCPC